MRLSVSKVLATGIIYLVGVLFGASGECVKVSETEESGSVQPRPCDNFYKHVCETARKNIIGTTPSTLRETLYRKIEEILKNDADGHESLEVETDLVGTEVNVLKMARRLYKTCIEDRHRSSGQAIKQAITEMLESIGIRQWPLTRTSQVHFSTYKEILQKTGLRPLATIAPVPDRKEPWYIVSVNGPLPRFGASPEMMKNIKRRKKKYDAYKAFLRSVISLFFRVENGPPTASERSDAGSSNHQTKEDDSEEYQSEKEKQEAHEAASDAESNEEDGDVVNHVISDIINVEIQLCKMMVSARTLDIYETHTVQDWDKRFGGKFPFMSGLRTDFDRAKITLANNHIVGVHLQYYFKELAKYLEKLNVKTLLNYLGWYFVREVADVLTTEIRESLNAFLKVISKPHVPKSLNADNCIEKLIGYHAKMEKAIAHLYLKKYFDESALNKASIAAQQVNVSFERIIQRNSWMDQETRTKMSYWIGELEYHIGAPVSLLDEKYIRSQYDLVKLLNESSLSLSFFALMENNFLQQVRLYMKPYDRREIWRTSSLETHGRYSPHYTALEMPAGVLQNPIFEFDAPRSKIFGSMGTLTAETLTRGFMEEGHGLRFWKGKYLWTERAKGLFKTRLQCLRKGDDERSPGPKSIKMDAQERFETNGEEIALLLKLYDHVGLRTSFEAFKHFVTQCVSNYSSFNDKDSKKVFKNFFYSYAMRHCASGYSDSEHRVNFALKTYEQFWSAFGCQDRDRMKGRDRCHIVHGADSGATRLIR